MVDRTDDGSSGSDRPQQRVTRAVAALAATATAPEILYTRDSDCSDGSRGSGGVSSTHDCSGSSNQGGSESRSNGHGHGGSGGASATDSSSDTGGNT